VRLRAHKQVREVAVATVGVPGEKTLNTGYALDWLGFKLSPRNIIGPS